MSENKHTPELVALTNAAWLEKSLTIGAQEAASELRRLHEVEKQRDELLAALEAEIVRLREALKHIKYETDIHGADLSRGIKDEAVEALSTPFTPTALNELIEKGK